MRSELGYLASSRRCSVFSAPRGLSAMYSVSTPWDVQADLAGTVPTMAPLGEGEIPEFQDRPEFSWETSLDGEYLSLGPTNRVSRWRSGSSWEYRREENGGA